MNFEMKKGGRHIRATLEFGKYTLDTGYRRLPGYKPRQAIFAMSRYCDTGELPGAPGATLQGLQPIHSMKGVWA